MYFFLLPSLPQAAQTIEIHYCSFVKFEKLKSFATWSQIVWCFHIYIISTTAIVKLILCLVIVCAPVSECPCDSKWSENTHFLLLRMCTWDVTVPYLLPYCVPWNESPEQQIQFQIYVNNTEVRTDNLNKFFLCIVYLLFAVLTNIRLKLSIFNLHSTV